MDRTWHKPLPAADLLLRGGRVVDPRSGIDAVQDVLVKRGRIAETGAAITAPKGAREVDVTGMLVLPGFVDLHAHLRAPGREDEEDVASGTLAAAAGGYVRVFAMANTDPAIDTAAGLRGMADVARAEAVVPLGFYGAVTRGLKGEQLTEMAELAEAGAVAFSDDGRPLATAVLVRRALQYAKITGRVVAVHGQDDSLFAGGQMHEGPVSARLGLAGIPSLCESLDVARALDMAAYEAAPLHVHHVSAAASLEALSRAKSTGLKVTAEATPHHLTMTDEAVVSLDSNVKMNPPLREEDDRQALVKALKSGLVDCVATDHAPHAPMSKDVPFEEAAFGTTGLETAFAVLYTDLVKRRALDLGTLVTRMSQAPAAIAGGEPPAIRPGALADLCVVDPRATWTVTVEGFKSKSANSAFLGRRLTGRVKLTVAAGRVAWEDDA
ncbi:MAG TPA: dihydroorotase [Thermoleophilia bacterium]|nr:dihydroorotase [Thermoleophilia bacterium]HQJ96990.1 dihydroorotase [Thermoleophilia bacterium]